MKEINYSKIHPEDPIVQRHREFERVRDRRDSDNLLSFHEQIAEESWNNDFQEVDHVIHHLNRVDTIREQLPWLVPSVKERIHDAISDGILPISHEHASTRMQRLDEVLIDSFDDNRHDTGDVAYYLIEPEVITLLSSTPRGKEEYVAVHETVHLLSGRTRLNMADDQGNPDVTAQRMGLVVLNPMNLSKRRDNFPFGGMPLHRVPVTHRSFARRFDWLNEALTEELTLEIMGDDDSEYYKKYRELFGMIQTQGLMPLPRSLFENAMFEEYIPGAAGRSAIPHWHRMMSAVNKAYPIDDGSGINRKKNVLVSIDDMLRNLGITRTIEIFSLVSPHVDDEQIAA